MHALQKVTLSTHCWSYQSTQTQVINPPPIQTQYSKILPRKITLIFLPTTQGTILHKAQEFTELGSTPVKVPFLQQYHAQYQNIKNVQFFKNGLKYIFYFNYIGSRVYLQPKNIVTVKYLAFVANKGMYLRRLEWTLPECCSPLNGWNDHMIYKKALIVLGESSSISL